MTDIIDHVNESEEEKWDDQTMDDEWKKLQQEKPEKMTFVASRFLLQKCNYKSEGSELCCMQYRPSKVFKIELQRQEDEEIATVTAHTDAATMTDPTSP